MIYLVKPTGEQRVHCIEAIGRDSWRYGGEFQKGHVNHALNGESKVIEVYFYDFDKILDADVQQHMIRSRAQVHHQTLVEAERYCRTHQCAVPCADVELEVLTDKSPFQGEEMQCCMCSKKQMSDPNVESNWTLIQLDGFAVYVCPACLQDSPQAKRGHYKTVYAKVVRRALRLRNRHLSGLNN